jgi:protein TonB
MPIILAYAEPPAAVAPASPPPASEAAAGPHGVAPDWVRKPTSPDIGRVYPGRALRAYLNGAAVMRCEVTAAGTLTACTVLSENPLDEGFGAAALKLAKLFVMRPQTKDGRPVAGGVIIIPITFRVH